MLESYLRSFAQEQDLGEWTPEEDGRYLVTFDGRFDVQIEQIDRSHFVLRSVLTRVPEDSQAAQDLYKRLLTANLGRWHQQAETIALDQENREILIYFAGNAEEMDYTGFSTRVEEFVNCLEFWQNQLQVPRPSSSPFSMVFP